MSERIIDIRKLTNNSESMRVLLASQENPSQLCLAMLPGLEQQNYIYWAIPKKHRLHLGNGRVVAIGYEKHSCQHSIKNGIRGFRKISLQSSSIFEKWISEISDRFNTALLQIYDKEEGCVYWRGKRAHCCRVHSMHSRLLLSNIGFRSKKDNLQYSRLHLYKTQPV